MKKTFAISLLCLFAVAGWAQLITQTITRNVAGGTTNQFIVDISQGSTLSLQGAFSGSPYRKTVAAFGIVTNPPALSNWSASVVYVGTTNTYTFTNSNVLLPGANSAASLTNFYLRWLNDFSASPPTLVNSNCLSFTTNSANLKLTASGGWASIAQTNSVTIGITTNAATNYGYAFQVGYAGVSNAYFFTNDAANESAFRAIVAGSDVRTTLDNIATRLAKDYPALTTTIGTSNITLNGLVGSSLNVILTNDWATNVVFTTGFVQVTNNPSASAAQQAAVIIGTTTNTYTWTNAPHVFIGSASIFTATNLTRRIVQDVPALIATQGATAKMSLTTSNGEAFTLFSSGAWITNGVTTNAIAGNLVLTGYKGNDGQTWFADTAYNLTLPYNDVTNVNWWTNYSSLPPFRFLRWTIGNNATNCAAAEDFTVTTGNR